MLVFRDVNKSVGLVEKSNLLIQSIKYTRPSSLAFYNRTLFTTINSVGGTIKWQLMTTFLLREVTEPTVSVQEVDKPHGVFLKPGFH